MKPPLVGILVGGEGRRMGGIAKGLLRSPDGSESLVERMARVAREAFPDAEPLLVGSASAYASLALRSLADAPAGIGPLGGLRALLCEAERLDAPFVVALACDLPFVSAALLEQLVDSAPESDCVAPRQGDRWQPLCARYASRVALDAANDALASGDHSLQRVLARLHVSELVLTARARAELDDWDEPGDLQRT